MGREFSEKDPVALPEVRSVEDRVDAMDKDLEEAKARVERLERRVKLLEDGD